MERTRGCLIALGIVFGIIIVAIAITVGVSWYLLSRPIPLEEEMTPVTVSQDAADRFQQKLDALEKQIKAAQKAGAEQPVRLELSPEETSSWAKRELDRAIKEGRIGLPSEVNDFRINFSPGQGSVLLKAAATGKFFGFKMPLGTTTEIEARDGQIWYQIQDIYLGNLPGFVKDGVMSTIENSLPQGRSGNITGSTPPLSYFQSLYVQRIYVEGNNLIVEGSVKKSAA